VNDLGAQLPQETIEAVDVAAFSNLGDVIDYVD
jgi:hypothetical protein